MRYRKGDFLGIPFIFLEGLDLNGFVYGFTTKDMGRDEVIRRFESHGLRLITAKQIHSSIVVRVEKNISKVITGDGLLTHENGLFIGVKTADCLPILLFDSEKRVVGAIHAGWRGTAKKVLSEGIKKLKEEFGSEPHNLIAILGPSISVCCYEIGPEVKEILSKTFPECIKKRGERFHFDLRKANRNLLLCSGVREENIYEIPLCTMCENELLFSHRRGEKERNIAFAGIYERSGR